jgi:hypothetical protein
MNRFPWTSRSLRRRPKSRKRLAGFKVVGEAAAVAEEAVVAENRPHQIPLRQIR